MEHHLAGIDPEWSNKVLRTDSRSDKPSNNAVNDDADYLVSRFHALSAEKFTSGKPALPLIQDGAKEDTKGLLDGLEWGNHALPEPGDPISNTDAPCSDMADCHKLEFSMMKCTIARVASRTVYENFCVVVHAIGVIVFAGCGCAPAGSDGDFMCPVKDAVACMIPQMVYISLYGITSTLWAAVKMATNVCMITADPIIAS
eukprot:GILJ01018675.1.p1 GENE.GILJ01018675.1~~GILJ01018675.1.p1  ORF type:complete len:201 (+),score=23.67 GILJ01018675.1:502-1104(+)